MRRSQHMRAPQPGNPSPLTVQLAEKVVGLINEAALNRSEKKPEAELVQVQEILLKRQPRLLPEFFEVSPRCRTRAFFLSSRADATCPAACPAACSG